MKSLMQAKSECSQPERQQYPEMHQKSCGQQEGEICLPLICLHDDPSGVLLPGLGLQYRKDMELLEQIQRKALLDDPMKMC